MHSLRLRPQWEGHGAGEIFDDFGLKLFLCFHRDFQLRHGVSCPQNMNAPPTVGGFWGGGVFPDLGEGVGAALPLPIQERRL